MSKDGYIGPRSKFVHMNGPDCFSYRTTIKQLATQAIAGVKGHKLVKIITQHHDNINVCGVVERVY